MPPPEPDFDPQDPYAPSAMMVRAEQRRVWLSVAVGVTAGVGMAVLAAWAAEHLWKSGPVNVPNVQQAALIPLFRLPAGQNHALLLCPAGPDGSGEQHLAQALFPGEQSPRELASVFVANASDTDPWDVDLAATTLRFRAGSNSDWQTFESLAGRLAGADERLSRADVVRLRGLGAGSASFRLEPRSTRRILLALPASRQFRELSDVEWGDQVLRSDEVDVDGFRILRQDPSRVP